MPKCSARAAGTSASGEHDLITPAVCRRDEAVLAERDPAGRSQTRGHPPMREVALRRGLLPPVAGLEVGERVRRRREDELRQPLSAVLTLAVVPGVSLAGDADVLARLVRHVASAQRQRIGEAGAEADVGQHRAVHRGRGDDEGHVVELVGEPAIRGRDPRRDEVDGIPQVAQQRSEESVELVAVAAAAGVDDLDEHGGQVETDRATEGDVEVLEGNCHEMRPVQRRERAQSRGLGGGRAQASEVGRGLGRAQDVGRGR